jgi:integrase
VEPSRVFYLWSRVRRIDRIRLDNLERGILLLTVLKTGKKAATLNAPSAEILGNLKVKADRERFSDYVFYGAEPDVPRSDLKKPWAALTKHAGLDGLRIHDLRHSFASVGAGAGLGLSIVGKLRWHTQASAKQRYSHLDVDPFRRAANTIGATIVAALELMSTTEAS